jgi:hypothetical protein
MKDLKDHMLKMLIVMNVSGNLICQFGEPTDLGFYVPQDLRSGHLLVNGL